MQKKVFGLRYSYLPHADESYLLLSGAPIWCPETILRRYYTALTPDNIWVRMTAMME